LFRGRECGRLLGCRCFALGGGDPLIWFGFDVLFLDLVECRTRILLGRCMFLASLEVLKSRKGRRLDIVVHVYGCLDIC